MIEKFIYFPTDKKPVIIFCDCQMGDEYRGSTILKEVKMDAGHSILSSDVNPTLTNYGKQYKSGYQIVIS